MKLDENYSVNHDGTQWILSYEKATGEINKKTGKETITKNQWYHGKLSHSISSYIDKKLSAEETVDETINVLKTLLKEAEAIKIEEKWKDKI